MRIWGLALALVVCVGLPSAASAVDRAVSAGEGTCALRSSATVVCFGDVASPEVSLGFAKAVSTGQRYACAVRADDTVSCWGEAGPGRTDVPDSLGEVVKVSAGTRNTCAIRADGAAVCWGDPATGVNDPPPGLGPVSDISNFADTACAVRQPSSELACWGALADAPPVQVTRVSTGRTGVCAIYEGSGSLACSDADDGTPTPEVVGARDVAKFPDGPGGCYIDADGALSCWGTDFEGHDRLIPPESLGMVRSVTIGSDQTCVVLATSGYARCWGREGSPNVGSRPATPGPRPPERAELGQPFEFRFDSFTGNPPGIFRIGDGALTPGLSLSPDGVLSGTPTRKGQVFSKVLADNDVFVPVSRNLAIEVVGDADAPPRLTDVRLVNEGRIRVGTDPVIGFTANKAGTLFYVLYSGRETGILNASGKCVPGVPRKGDPRKRACRYWVGARRFETEVQAGRQTLRVDMGLHTGEFMISLVLQEATGDRKTRAVGVDFTVLQPVEQKRKKGRRKRDRRP